MISLQSFATLFTEGGGGGGGSCYNIESFCQKRVRSWTRRGNLQAPQCRVVGLRRWL